MEITTKKNNQREHNEKKQSVLQTQELQTKPKTTRQETTAEIPYYKIHQYSKEDDRNQDAKQKPRKTKEKYAKFTMRNKTEKSPEEQLVVSRATLASRKNKIKKKVYQKFKDGDINKYGWLQQKSEVIDKNHIIWL